MTTLSEFMGRYDHEHTNPWNKAFHAIGIPIIFAGIILLLLLHWKLGLGLFISGWILLFLGHRLEGNHPAFFQGPIYFLVGPIWVARELLDFVLGRAKNPPIPNPPPTSPQEPGH